MVRLMEMYAGMSKWGTLKGEYMTQINSHVQIPRCILKQFEDDKHMLYWYDCSDGRIKRGHAKTINTIKGYYPEELERYLSEHIEHPIAHVIQTLKSMDNMHPLLAMSDEMKQAIWRYFYAVIQRARNVHTKIEKEAKFLQLFPDDIKRKNAIVWGIEDACYFNLFRGWVINISINTTNEPFVLPLCGFYTFAIQDFNTINIPLTPTYAITLVPVEYMLRYTANGKIKMFSIDDPALAKYLNQRAIKAELESNNVGIVAATRASLCELIPETAN